MTQSNSARGAEVAPASGSLPSDPSTPPSDPSTPPEASKAQPPEASTTAPPTGLGVEYKGGELDAARGPGLGCFYVQLTLLVTLLVVTPITVAANWPPIVSMTLLVGIIVLLLFAGQTVIFLLRLVAAERGPRRPLASGTRTVGEMTRESGAEASGSAGGDTRTGPAGASGGREGPPEHGGSVRE